MHGPVIQKYERNLVIGKHTRIDNAEAAYSVVFATSSPEVYIAW